ncbi:Protein of unknown function [Pyronema omphalodes CBS 100304]|uniref:Uncharacterized protein n=1 Tax=Pyronema omphalodes (strain CBS 100304) TaxID=1076935 RepID=U4L6F9_PYROM|nr:Protein of unknown function [Pyronema omphalodes CBS 100304]
MQILIAYTTLYNTIPARSSHRCLSIDFYRDEDHQVGLMSVLPIPDLH